MSHLHATWNAARVLLLLTLAACGNQSSGGALPDRPSIDLSRTTLVDLTHALDSATLFWPTSPTGFHLERLAYGMTPGGWFYSSNAFSLPEHGGTHLDAPIHFAEGKRTADEIPLRQLVAPAVVIDIRDSAAQNPDYRLSASDVAAFERRYGTIPAGTIVLLRTGWDRRWPDRKAYFGDDTPGDATRLHFPSYGEEAARVLVTERKVGALGVDVASIDYGQSQDFMVHRVAAAADVAGLENLEGLDQVPATGAWVVALPMKIRGGSGGPVRVMALIPGR